MNDPSVDVDPQKILIDWLVSRTQQGRLTWHAEAAGLTTTASLPPRVHVRFATRSNASGQCVGWISFHVRVDHREIVCIDSAHAPDAIRTLVAVCALFESVIKTIPTHPPTTSSTQARPQIPA